MNFKEEILWEEGSAELYSARNDARKKIIEGDIRKIVDIMWHKADRPEYYGSASKPATAADIINVMLRNKQLKCNWVYTKPSVKDLYINAATSLKKSWNDMVFQAYYKKILKAAGGNTVIPNEVTRIKDDTQDRYNYKRVVNNGQETYVKEEVNWFPY